MTGRPFIPTAEQERVIGHAGSSFIAACPGAGKTRVLVERARVLLQDTQNGQGVAYLSFTNAAVSELRMRLQKEALLPSPLFPHYIGTFDSFLWQFLVAPFGIPNCTVAPRLIPDKGERTVSLPNGLRELPLACFDPDTGEVVLEKARRYGFDPAAKPAQTKAYVTAARAARKRFAARGELDFDEARKVAAARRHDPVLSPRLATALAARFREVVVDEAQDCNPADLEVIAWLRKAGVATKVICDPHQSIFEFRGGVTDQLFDFRLTFPEEDRLLMSGNFRSSDHICKAIVSFRALNSRSVVDQALGEHRADSTPVYILSYPGQSVPASIGTKFRELVAELNVEPTSCPVLAKTNDSAAKAIGRPTDTGTQNLTLRLASAVMSFRFATEMDDRRLAMEEVHKVVLAVQGRMGNKTYHQYLAAENIQPDVWRPHILHIMRELRYESAVYSSVDAWHSRAKELLAPHLPTQGGLTIAQRLPRNQAIGNVLTTGQPCSFSARTIHSVKGRQFPAVCVVMTPPTTKGILDYLDTGEPQQHAESAREIYVAASRAQRLLVIAAPKSQASRLLAHVGKTSAQVTLIEI